MVENHCNIKCETHSTKSDSRPEGRVADDVETKNGTAQPGREEPAGDNGKGHSLAEGAALHPRAWCR